MPEPTARLMRPLLLLLALVGALLSASCPAAEADRVFVLHSYSQEYPWTSRQHQGFVAALQAAHDAELVIETEYLDTKRRRYDADYAAAFADHLRYKYAGFQPDVAYVTDDNALTFALALLDSIFPGTPVVFSGVNNVDALRDIGTRPVTGVFEKKEIAPNLALLAAMGQSAGTIIVVGDDSPTYRAIEQEVRRELRGYPEIRALFVAHERIDALLEQLQANSDGAVFLTTLGRMRDSTGRTLPLRETIRRIAAQAKRVIISMEDAYLIDGVLGGFVTSGTRQGAMAAAQAVRLLAGDPLPPPVSESPNEYLFDARQLAQHALTLPPAVEAVATLLHKPPSFYQRHRAAVVVALAAMSSLLILSLAGFAVVLSRKNRVIEQRSTALQEQAVLAMQARDRLNEAQHIARQGSWEWDRESNRFLWSDGLRQLCHEPHLQVDDSPDSFLRQMTEENRVAFMAAVERVCASGEQCELLHRTERKGGGVRYFREIIRLSDAHPGQTQRLIGIVQDVTERHMAETRLRESEEKYRRLFELSEDPMWLIVDGHFVMANEAASRLLGYDSVAALADVHPSVLSPPRQPDGQPSRDKANAMMRMAFDKGYHRFEWIHRKKDGSDFPVEVSLTRVPYHGGDALFCIWRDFTEMKAAQRALEEKTAYLDGILGSSEKVGIIATDPEGRIRYYSPSAAKLLGLPADQALGITLDEIHRRRGVAAHRYESGLEQARLHGEYRFTIHLQQEDGMHVIDGRVSPIDKLNHEFAGYMLMCEDVSEQRRASEIIEYQATYDALTDLPNRRLFLNQLNQALARARRHGHQSAVLFLDLDNFKTINDSLGHPVGDALLRAVAERVKQAVREEDTVARLGGDEFVILVAELSDDRDEAVIAVQALAEKLRQYLAQSYLIGVHELHVTPSVGIAVFPSGEDSADDILRQADTAMYQAKESGRNAVRFFLPSMQQAAEQRLTTITQLRQALPRGELRLCYQPQYDVGRQLCGAEALLRWQHPERGLVMPAEFIHLAEEAGQILAIGDWVMREALRQFKSWHAAQLLAADCRIAVNVSALQFRQADFVNKVERALGDAGAAPHWLTLEMTESILLQDFDETVKKINTLKRLGVRFAIDDFGTGYSSLAYLKRLPVDEIKIDRAFVRDIMTDANDAALVDTILTLARHIGLEVVAEGVESAAVFEFLRERGCPLFQGYHFGRPATADEFASHWLTPPSPAAISSGI